MNVVRNLSNQTLTNIEFEILYQGLEFSFYPTSLDINYIRVEFESFYSRVRSLLSTSQSLILKQKLISLYSIAVM